MIRRFYLAMAIGLIIIIVIAFVPSLSYAFDAIVKTYSWSKPHDFQSDIINLKKDGYMLHSFTYSNFYTAVFIKEDNDDLHSD